MEPLPLVPVTCRMSGGGCEEDDDGDGASFKSSPIRRRYTCISCKVVFLLAAAARMAEGVVD